MTNGAATGGDVEIDVTRRTEIVALTMGDRRLLVPGATVMALAQPTGGSMTAVAIIAETNGVKPPM